MNSTIETIAKNLLAGNRRALARAISIVENGGKQAHLLVHRLFATTGKAHLIGITGAPGVGKSTLVDALITEIRKANLKVGVLAIDPTSPFSGGAILGDRIRMQDHTLDNGVFIRSMANRGHSGGTSLATYDAVRMLEASGYDVVIIETVGVGQSELAIAKTADTTILVLMPGSGDEIQAIKSGIMEISDIFVVNKGDLPGAKQTSADIMHSLELATKPDDWSPPVKIVVAETGSGIEDLWKDIQNHKSYLQKTSKLTDRRKIKAQAELEDLIAETARQNLKNALSHSHIKELLTKVVSLEIDPHQAAEQIARELFEEKN